jgi:integrase
MTRAGRPRYAVEYRVAGRESPIRYAGTFGTRREADVRKMWVAGELAAVRLPDPSFGVTEASKSPTLREVAEAWRSSRVDVAGGTADTYTVNLTRILARLGDREVDTLEAADVAALVADLHANGEGLARESIRKTRSTLAQVLDFAKVEPNPARDTSVKLPREDREPVNPPTADHVEAVFRLLNSDERLKALWLDWSGARVASVDKLTVGDYDERHRRVRVRASTTKNKMPLWIDLPAALADAIEATLPPREDRDLAARLFQGENSDALRTAIGRACKAAGVPLWSPHDLRHRRISLLHDQGKSWARIAEFVGQRSLKVTADTYTHVLTDGRELDYAALLGGRA